MKNIILKFGGTSVGSPENIKKVLEIYKNISSDIKEKCTIKAIVVSAFSKVTDTLITAAKEASEAKAYDTFINSLKEKHLSFANELIPATYRARVITEITVKLDELENILKGIKIIRELSPKTLDLVSSFGERLSAYIISEYFISQDIQAEFLDLRDLIITDNNFNNARVKKAETFENLLAHFSKHSVLQIATGFIGSYKNTADKNIGDGEKETTTLGRGGSDYTAAILGAALNVDRIEIWTDVDGILTADPRKVEQAFPIPTLSYEDAMELSHFGAKVIYPPTMTPALEKKIPIVIKNTFNPNSQGSLINQNPTPARFIVTGISSLPEIALMRIQGSGMVGIAGVATRLFGTLAKEKINIILITQASSEHTICFAVTKSDGIRAKKVIDEEFKIEIEQKFVDPIILEEDSSIVAVVGDNMRNIPGISGRIFKAIGRNGINIRAIAQGSSERNISIVVASSDETKTLQIIHDEFFLSDTKSVHVYIAGTGTIGSELINQISSNVERLKTTKRIDIKINGVLNRRDNKISQKGLTFEECLKVISAQPNMPDSKPTDNKSTVSFAKKIQELNLPSSVFVDCTADQEICNLYPEISKSGIQIVTANKKSLTGELESYKTLKEGSSGRFFYETCVGAGLPVISTLNDLINSGDKIIKVEAVLSGTLSYIFNTFSSNNPFSSLVKQARELGFTEPDPRDDLSGKDVARKLLILARDSGLDIEMNDIQVEDLTPEALRDIPDVTEFLTKLSEFDTQLEAKRLEAEKRDSRLLYIGSFEIEVQEKTTNKLKVANKTTSAKLTEVSSAHPFYKLSGRDNIVSFTTLRYSDRPLVVQGPGAGAGVTAAGVFADILKGV